MILDGHIHITKGDRTDSCGFTEKLKDIGMDGGVVISLPPTSFRYIYPGLDLSVTTQDRLDNLFAWTRDSEKLYPFYWVDPMDPDAAGQVQTAAKRGVMGFKIICNSYYPSDKQAVKLYSAIAELNKPILFHSGILWDGEASSKYNHPDEFEVLLEVKDLRFALAHVSWPWCDELIGIYGKSLNTRALRPDLGSEMFVDLTPGTPAFYRRDALTKLFTIGYNVQDNVLFGTDQSVTHDTDRQVLKELINSDAEIYNSLGLEQNTIDKIFSGNLERFLGLR